MPEESIYKQILVAKGSDGSQTQAEEVEGGRVIRILTKDGRYAESLLADEARVSFGTKFAAPAP